MAVAKKKIKKSVERNRVKRMVRESFRVNGTLPAVDIVVLPTARCDGADSAVLRASLDKHWARIAITCRSR
jgi:ribonuclease P protein component